MLLSFIIIISQTPNFRKYPLQGLRLLEFHIGVAVAVLDVEWVQVDLRDAGEVAVGFLVGVGRVVFLVRDELVGLPAFHRLELGVLHCKAAQVTPDGVRAAEAVVGVCLESLLPEEVHILQYFAAANEDGREILNDVGIGISRVYSLDSQYLVNQCGKSG